MTFLNDYIMVLAAAIGADFDDNHDDDRFGAKKRIPLLSKETLRRLLARCGLVLARSEKRQ